MDIRNLLLNILIGLGVVGFLLGVAAIETIPFWVAAIISIVLWVIYMIFVIRDHSRDIKYPLVRVRPDPPVRIPKKPQTAPYNQEEDHG